MEESKGVRSSKKGSVISIELSTSEALVLFELLARINNLEKGIEFDDQAEERVLWDLEASFESLLVEILDPNYDKLLKAARNLVRDED
ncbi:MAG: hypothetical protein DWQ47_10925 [Acidobacteria bacterium]|nr:MAG: hypothetical protein DWQ32_13340 [Acidobacteriota bacterium]REJ98095.1 MAG: hypothetical protein DWQ38_16140 [Acidobacteriota bacterium]REK16838.1 MAG: hypothetical protein DWQ43_01185 [Acidobacteriota bacterium]REK42749.1 MAG: hypothetical protein DWQ47_10925 [Acidobacteriota bacterium]